ncbi:DUF2249 domain-containing protein [Noviherbaspirillum denitrificans]|uniref:DUF2249 domain-containing protein n=1 Tax=Noviherbaspirillum denitrificans TaxID=1968433 RepID=A0A254TFN8_9BURK|nr:DUF2249 domain-containing protein [Noviherbaspirillum denitrificans]OWW21461.1 hypothetical protein AYR66_20185 [Noviherbaspirillum denitrificans]
MSEGENIVDIDVCGLEPPEPLERVLDALNSLQPGQRLRVLIPREPFPLYNILERNGYQHASKCREDFLYEVLIWQ